METQSLKVVERVPLRLLSTGVKGAYWRHGWDGGGGPQQSCRQSPVLGASGDTPALASPALGACRPMHPDFLDLWSFLGEWGRSA